MGSRSSNRIKSIKSVGAGNHVNVSSADFPLPADNQWERIRLYTFIDCYRGILSMSFQLHDDLAGMTLIGNTWTHATKITVNGTSPYIISSIPNNSDVVIIWDFQKVNDGASVVLKVTSMSRFGTPIHAAVFCFPNEAISFLRLTATVNFDLNWKEWRED